MLRNSSGLPGLELLVPLFFTGCLERDLSPTLAVRMLSYNPARHFRLTPFKGALELGADADIVVLEPAQYRFDPAKAWTCVDWSPYEGRLLRVKIAGTWARGELVFDGARILSQPGSGRFVAPVRAHSARDETRSPVLS
jgi:allantoinase